VLPQLAAGCGGLVENPEVGLELTPKDVAAVSS
jgi:hypothetical protein